MVLTTCQRIIVFCTSVGSFYWNHMFSVNSQGTSKRDNSFSVLFFTPTYSVVSKNQFLNSTRRAGFRTHHNCSYSKSNLRKHRMVYISLTSKRLAQLWRAHESVCVCRIPSTWSRLIRWERKGFRRTSRVPALIQKFVRGLSLPATLLVRLKTRKLLLQKIKVRMPGSATL